MGKFQDLILRGGQGGTEGKGLDMCQEPPQPQYTLINAHAHRPQRSTSDDLCMHIYMHAHTSYVQV